MASAPVAKEHVSYDLEDGRQHQREFKEQYDQFQCTICSQLSNRVPYQRWYIVVSIPYYRMFSQSLGSASAVNKEKLGAGSLPEPFSVL